MSQKTIISTFFPIPLRFWTIPRERGGGPTAAPPPPIPISPRARIRRNTISGSPEGEAGGGRVVFTTYSFDGLTFSVCVRKSRATLRISHPEKKEFKLFIVFAYVCARAWLGWVGSRRLNLHNICYESVAEVRFGSPLEGGACGGQRENLN